jgi:hypothetical protein
MDPSQFDPTASQPDAVAPSPADADATPFAAPDVAGQPQPFEGAPSETAPPSPPEVDVDALRAELDALRAEREHAQREREQIRQAYAEARHRAEMEAAEKARLEEATFYRNRQAAIERGDDPVQITQATDAFHRYRQSQYERQLAETRQQQEYDAWQRNMQGAADALRQSVQQYAQQTAQKHGLTTQEAQRLAYVHPEHMESFAADMARGRQAQQRYQQTQSAQQLADRQQRGADLVGGVNGGGGSGAFAPGSDDHLKHLLARMG